MDARALEQLRPLAARYVWWQSVKQASQFPERVVAQVMDIGTFEDVQLLSQSVSEKDLCDVLQQAEAGQFTPRSWHYWHYRLGLSQPGEVPSLPVRVTA